jgi:general secretion pathway protein D
VRNALKAIKFFDAPIMRGKYNIKIEPVFLTARQLAKNLSDVLKTEGYAVHIGAGASSSSVILLPIETTNSLFVFTAKEETISHIRDWVLNLDSANKIVGEEQTQLFFYPVKNTKAEDLSEVLTPLLSGVLAPEEDDNKGKPNARKNNQQQQLNSGNSIVVDKIRNALLYQGDIKVWARMLPILKSMDKPAKQVLVEVTIAEVILSDQESFGLQWNLLQNAINLGGSSYSARTAFDVGVGGQGLTYSLINTLGQTKAILNALQNKSKVNILSTPHIMVKSGESASISSGDDVPVLSSRSVASEAGLSGGTSNFLEQVQYRSTGINLTVSPVVYAGNQIDLDISQTVSRALPDASGNVGRSPTIYNRSIQTKLTLTDGGSVLLGGLVETNNKRDVTGIPFLMDIPILGSLFKTDGYTTERKELLILIVPYVINNNLEAREITESFRQKLKGGSDFIKKIVSPE